MSTILKILQIVATPPVSHFEVAFSKALTPKNTYILKISKVRFCLFSNPFYRERSSIVLLKYFRLYACLNRNHSVVLLQDNKDNWEKKACMFVWLALHPNYNLFPIKSLPRGPRLHLWFQMKWYARMWPFSSIPPQDVFLSWVWAYVYGNVFIWAFLYYIEKPLYP